jgi:hypothetical protein
MELRLAHAARAFSSHAFPEAYPYLSPDVQWELVGGRFVEGKDAVIAVCEEVTRELAVTTATFSRFDVVVAEDRVIVESRASYVDEDGGTTEVASCDIYDRTGETIVRITSYNIGLGGA